MLEGTDAIFDIQVTDYIGIIRYEIGDEVTIEYKVGEETNTVLSLNGKTKTSPVEREDEDTEEESTEEESTEGMEEDS